MSSLDQVAAQSDTLMTLRDAFLKNAIDAVDRPFGLRETVLVARMGAPADPEMTGAAHNERPA